MTEHKVNQVNLDLRRALSVLVMHDGDDTMVDFLVDDREESRFVTLRLSPMVARMLERGMSAPKQTLTVVAGMEESKP